MSTIRTNTIENVAGTFSIDTIDLGGAIPIGGIISFSGTLTSLPANWKVCDGTNGTVNLVSRFIYGTATQGEINVTTGGSANAVIVSHTHPINVPSMTKSTGSQSASHEHYTDIANTKSASQDASHTHSYTRSNNIAAYGYGSATGSTGGSANTGNQSASHEHWTNPASTKSGSQDASHTHSFVHDHGSFTSDAATGGVSGTNANLPPYLKLAYIQRIS